MKDEIKVKDIVLDAGIKEDFELDTNITHELKRRDFAGAHARDSGLPAGREIEAQDIIGLFWTARKN